MTCKRKYNLFGAVIICLTALIVYSNTFDVPFIFDDRSAIPDNPAVRSFDLPRIYGSTPLRALPYISFALNYQFHGEAVWGYHLINLIIHILSGLVVWRLALLIFRRMGDSEMPSPGKTPVDKPFSAALFAGLLFIVHPVQTQAVTYIVQRMASMAALFYIAAVFLYACSRSQMRAGSTGRVCYGFSLLSALCAVHCKENTITLPAAVALYELCFENRQHRTDWFLLLPYVLVSAFIPLYTINVSSLSLDQISKATAETANISRVTYLLTEFRVIVTYLRLLLLPVHQNLDYDYRLATSLFEPRIFFSFLLLSAIGIAGTLAFWRNRLVTFCVFWFYISLSVESTIIPIRDVIFEHRLYLAMPAFALILSYFVWWQVPRLSRRICSRSSDMPDSTS